MEQENKKVEFVSLNDVLNENLDLVTGEVDVELVNGKVIKLPIKAITAETEAAIRKKCTKYVQTKQGRFPELDDAKYNAKIIEAGTDSSRTNLDWGSQELATKVGAVVPAAEFTVPKVLSLGGIVKAAEEITRLSGLDIPMNEAVEAARD